MEIGIENYQIVYVLSNSAMPGLIKIGFTIKNDAKARIEQLYSTGVPVPFTIEFAARVPNAAEIERALHTAFAPYRINPRREFFKIDAEQAIAILRLLHTEEETSEVRSQPSELDQQSTAAAENLRARRPPLNFLEMGIPIGAILESTDGPTTVTVASARKVMLGGEEMSLTAVTQDLLQLDYAVAPSQHWTYEGRLLRNIYNETYSDAECSPPGGE